MMAQIQQMQEQMAQAQAELAEATVTATAGVGVITVIMTGDQVCKSVEIAPELLEDADVEMLQDLIVAAVNEAARKVDEEAQNQLGSMAGNMKIPGLF